MTTIKVTEEIKAEHGLTPEEIRNGIWNSPPAVKGEGRYLLTGKGIEPHHFAHLKKQNWIRYWSRDFLEDCDMFFDVPGWRIDFSGIKYLREQEYDVKINTLEDQKAREAKRQQEAKEKAEQEKREKEEAAAKMKREIEDFEDFLGNPEYEDAYKENGERDYEETRVKGFYSEHSNPEEVRYGISAHGRVYKFVKISFDWWNHFVSTTPAPQQLIDLAAKLETERKAKQEEEAQKRQEEQDNTRYMHMQCPRCGRFIYANSKYEEKRIGCAECHTGKKATEKTTVAFKKIGEILCKDIPDNIKTMR